MIAEVQSALSAAVEIVTQADGYVIFTTAAPLASLTALRSIESVSLLLSIGASVPLRSLPPNVSRSRASAEDLAAVEKYFRSIPESPEFEPALFSALRSASLPAVAPLLSSPSFPSALFTDSLTFRVSCCRTYPVIYHGRDTHDFKSPDAARWLGSALRSRYHWTVDLKHPDIDIGLLVVGPRCFTVLYIARDLHLRHPKLTAPDGRSFSAPLTALNCSTAYCLGSLASIQPNSVVLDPFNGIGTIPIECAMQWPRAVYFGSDIDAELIEQARLAAKLQLDHLASRPAVEFLVSDARFSFLRPCSVDLVISDVPFGRRHGSFSVNQSLYVHFVRECARMLKLGGRMIILTAETNLFKRTVESFSPLAIRDIRVVSIGGMRSEVFNVEKVAEVEPLSEEQIKRFKVKEKRGAQKRKVAMAQAMHKKSKASTEGGQEQRSEVDQTQSQNQSQCPADRVRERSRNSSTNSESEQT